MKPAEIAAMRSWMVVTAQRLRTFSPDLPSAAEIDAMPEERIAEVVEQFYSGGTHRFRWDLQDGCVEGLP